LLGVELYIAIIYAMVPAESVEDAERIASKAAEKADMAATVVEVQRLDVLLPQLTSGDPKSNE
jgi:hypothetical protein